MNIKNKYSLSILILILAILLVGHFRHFNVKTAVNPYPIAWDVYGYYLYLPATFIYNDLGLENETWIKATREKYNPSSTFYQVANIDGNKKAIIYNVGYAIINAPGFFIAHALAPAFGFERDGFSKPYQLALLYTALLITIVGLVLFRKLLLLFFSDSISSILLLLIFLGTNYLFQAIYDGVMPHNILFTINCFILWYTIKWYNQPVIKNTLLLAFSIGIASICRPTELIWLLVPLLYGVNSLASFVENVKLFFRNYKQLIVFALVLILIILIQFIYTKYSTGSFFELNLHSERFSFFDPYTVQFLFSYKKGWLLYTPIMIFAIIGFYFLKKQNEKMWLPLLAFFAINLYVVSSWECWWYAASFSQRPMVETYAMMAFPLGAFITFISRRKIWIQISVGVLFLSITILNLFQIWQYKRGILTGETMTKNYYWKIFGKTSFDVNDRQYLSVDHYQDNFADYDNFRDKYYKKDAFYLDFEKDGMQGTIDTIAQSGKKCFMLNSEVLYSPAFEESYRDITNKNYIWLRASVWVYLTAPYNESNSAIVISTETKEKSYKYLTSNYSNFSIKPFVWTEIYLDYITPDIRHSDDKVKVYFWNMGSKPIFIDNFKIEIFEPKRNE